MKNTTLKALIFDVDGTMADTERDGHRVAFNAAFDEYGIDWHWDVEFTQQTPYSFQLSWDRYRAAGVTKNALM